MLKGINLYSNRLSIWIRIIEFNVEKCKFDMLKAKCVSSFHTLTQNDGVVLGLAGIYSINFYQTLHY